MNLFESNEMEFNFQVENVPSEPVMSPPPCIKRKYDKTLFARGKVVSTSLEKTLQQNAVDRLQLMTDAPKGVTYRVKVTPVVSSTPGAWKVLKALIDLTLSQRGALMTQTACREEVQRQFPQHSVCKDWTKPMPKWAMTHAKKRILTSAPPISTLKFKNDATLSDMHKAAKVACAKSSADGLTVKASVTVTNDAVMINGHSFRLTVNKSNGKEYPLFRITTQALLKALKS
jgi:hypothetical protein